MATYSETVLADAPLLYYQLNENPDVSAGGRNVVNSGSVGGNGVTTYSASGTMTKAASAPGYIGGTSLEFNNNQAYISQSSGTITSTKDFSIELWWKRNMGYAAASGTMTIGRWSGGSGGTGVFDISIGSAFSTPQILVSISNGSTYPINTTAVTNITDGNWHHLVVTYTTSDSKFRLYVDGALKSTSATTTTTANTTGTFYWGGVSTPGGDGWIDEAAFYNKTLTATQVANHYNAAMTVPTLNVTATPPAMTASMSAPAPTQYIAFDNTVAVPAMATSIATPDPIVTAQFVDSQIDIPTADRSTATGSGTAANITFHYSTGNSQIGFQFPTPTIPAGKRVQTATFKVYNNGSVTRPVAIRRATAAWSEGDTATFTSTATGAVSATLAPGWNSFDITAFVNLWLTGTSNYGVILSDAEFNFSAAATSIAAKENTDATLRPTLTTVREAIPAVNINVSAPVMAVSMAAPAPVITAQQNVSNVAPVAALELTAIGAGVLTSVNTISTAPVISAGVEFKGGTSFNPDYATTVPAMTLSLTSVNPNQKIEYVVNVAAPAIYLGNLENEIASVSLTTNRLVVAPVMNLSMKWPGIYVEQADRYISLLNSTLPNNGKESVWYKLGGEAVGATRITDATANTRMDGYVFGNPDFNVPDGPGLRKAAHFDGVDDYIVTGPYSNNGLYNNTQDIKANDHAVTIEFSIRTTQMNGTIFNATGGGNGGLASISPTYFAYPNITKRLKLKDGYLYVSDGGTNVKLRSGFISDGEWHHVVMSLGANAGPGIPADVQGKNYLMVDGKTVLVNYYISGGEAWTPYAFMADADFQGTAYESGNGGSGQGGPRPARGKNVTDYLAGDLRDVIVRLNTYVPELAARRLTTSGATARLLRPRR
jgi:hypothetical protein